MIRTILTAFLLLVSIPASAGFKEGVDAFKRADYAAALREFEPLAIAGDASAQTNLGLLYSKGIGVPQNDAEAVKWYRYAAEQGHAVAQNNLGALYINGLGGPKDPILGLAWLLLSAEGGYQAAVEGRFRRSQPDGLGVVGDGAVVVALVGVGTAPQGIGADPVLRRLSPLLKNPRAAGNPAVELGARAAIIIVALARRHGRHREQEGDGPWAERVPNDSSAHAPPPPGESRRTG